MPTITNTFFYHSSSRKLTTSEEFFTQVKTLHSSLTDSEDIAVWGVGFTLAEHFDNKEIITTRGVEQLENELLDYERALGTDPVYTQLTQGLVALRGTGREYTTTLTPATDTELEITHLLGDYANLVRASHMAAGHGKSWEPAITIYIDHQGEISTVSLASYQGGDRETFHSDHSPLVDSITTHIQSVKSKLLRGSTNTNPMLMALIGDNTDTAEGYYATLTGSNPHPYDEVLLHEGAFLPRFIPGHTIECGGYPECYNQPTVDMGCSWYPELRYIIGYPQVRE